MNAIVASQVTGHAETERATPDPPSVDGFAQRSPASCACSRSDPERKERCQRLRCPSTRPRPMVQT